MSGLTKQKIQSQAGQGTVEYILLLSIIVSFFLFLSRGLQNSEAGRRLMEPLAQDYRTVYQFGKKGVVGSDNGNIPNDHPRFESPSNNFRIFLNPGRR